MTVKQLIDIIREELNSVLQEKAPPGREDQVKALKGKVDNPYAVAWSSYNNKKKKKKK